LAVQRARLYAIPTSASHAALAANRPTAGCTSPA
jgi:hypothetical protein